LDFSLFRYKTIRLIRQCLYVVNPFEVWRMVQLQSAGHLLLLAHIKNIFKNVPVFALGTGGSVANLKGIERLKDRCTFTVTMGGLYLPLCYGFYPTIWFLHNEDTIEMCLHELERENARRKLNFLNTYIFVPRNFTDAKTLTFSSPLFRHFRNIIGPTRYVLYRESFSQQFDVDNVPLDFLPGREPFKPMTNSSAVEMLFLPVLTALGVREIYFSGVDGIPDTGHFWDSNKIYQDMHGKPLTFPQKERYALCHESIKPLLSRNGISVWRLELKRTLLTSYPYMDFEEALARTATRWICK
jgi:hypothetical protein